MKLGVAVVLLACVLQLVAGYIVIQDGSGNAYDQFDPLNTEVSNTITLYASYSPAFTGSNAKTYQVTSSNSNAQITPGSFTISSTSPTQVLTLSTGTTQATTTFTFTDQTANNPDAPSTFTVTMALKTFRLDQGSSESYEQQTGSLVIGHTSLQNAISLSTPLQGSDSVTLVPSGGTVTFTPIGTPNGQFTFDKTHSIIPFTYMGSSATTQAVTWTISGSAAAQFSDISYLNKNVLIVDRPIFINTQTSTNYVGLQSAPITVSLGDAPPSGTFTLTPTIADTSKITFSTNTLTFSPTVTSQTFTYTANAPLSNYPVTFTLSGSNIYDATTVGLLVTATLRPVTFSGTYFPSNGLVLNEQSSPVFVTLAEAPPTGVTVRIITNSDVVLSTNTLVFTQTTLTQSFTVETTTLGGGTLSYSLEGPDAALYTLSNTGPYTTVSGRLLDVNVALTQPINVFCGQSVTTSVSIESAPTQQPLTVSVTSDGTVPGITINPPSHTFQIGDTKLSFTITISGSAIGSGGTVQLSMTGPDAVNYESFNPIPVTFKPRAINTPSIPSINAGAVTQESLTLNAPTATSLSVGLSATGVTFQPSTLTFAAGQASAAFTMNVSSPGTYNINYNIASGGDAPCFASTVYTTQFSANPLELDSSYNNPSLGYIPYGQSSTPITLSIPGLTSTVSIQPYAVPSSQFVTIKPAAVTLSASSPSATFYVSSTDFSVPSFTIKYIVTSSTPGFDPSTIDTSFASINVNFGTIPYVNTPFKSGIYGPTAQNAYVGVPSPVQSLVLMYPPVGTATVTMSAPGITFNPSQLVFSPTVTVQTFTFTPTVGDVADGSIARTVTWTVSGSPDVAVPAATSTIEVWQRPLSIISSAFLGPMYVGQKFAMTVVASIPPTNGITLTAGPQNSGPTPSPFSFDTQVLTMNPGNTAVTFTGTILGLVGTAVTVSVSGPDANFYVSTITGTTVNVNPSKVNLNTVNLLSGTSLLSGETGYGTITLDSAPVSDLTVVVTNDLLTVSPNTFTFTPSSPLSVVFSVTPTLNYPLIAGQIDSFFTVGVSGTDAPNYVATPATSEFHFSTTSSGLLRPVSLSPQTLSVTMGGVVNSPLILSITDAAPTGVTFTPVVQGHSEITFSPPSVTFSGSVTSASFLMQGATTYAPLGAVGYFEVSGPDAYLYATQANFNSLYFVVTFARTTLPLASLSFTTTAGLPLTIQTTQLSALPANSIYVYPVVISGPQLTFTPSFFSYTPTQQSTSISVSGNTVGTSQVALVVNGTDAYWIATPVKQITIVTKAKQLTATTDSFSVKPGETHTLTVSINSPPATALTVQPVCNLCTFNSPSQVTFTPSSAFSQTITYSVNTAAVSSATINFVVTGTDAGTYTSATTSVNINPRTITIAANTVATGGTGSGTISLDEPAVNGVTVAITAPGATFNPNSFTFATGQTQQTFTYQLLAGVATTPSIQFTLSGQDAGWYQASTTQSLSGTQPTIVASTATGTVPTPNGLTTYFRLTTSTGLPVNLVDTVTVTPVAAGVTFSPATITLAPGQTDVLVAATLNSGSYASLSGQSVTVTFTTTGATNTNPTISPVTLNFQGLQIDSQTAFSVALGATSPEQIITVSPHTLLSSSAIQMSQAVTLNLFSSTGDTITPSQVTITPPSYLATYTLTANQVGSGTIYYSVAGTGSGALFPTTYGVLTTYTVTPRAFDFGTGFMTADYVNAGSLYSLYVEDPTVFIYGMTTRMFTVYTTVASDVTLTPVSDYFTFTPSSLSFSQSVNSANVTMKATKIGRAVVTWQIGGGDAALFTRPSTYSLIVSYNINIGAIPTVHVGQTSKNVPVTISPTPAEPVFVTLPTSNQVVFNPARLVFTPTSTKATFTVTGRNPTVSSAASVLATPGYYGLAPLAIGASGSAYSAGQGVQLRHASETASYFVPLMHPAVVTVTPGLISVKHPRYQMDVTSHVQFEVNPAPLSDLTVALWGNNLLFDPPFATFTPNTTSVKVKATPRQTISYEINYTPFRVEYACSGTNQGHYVCPTETLHFFAMPRGYVAAIVLVPLFVIVLIVVFMMFCRGGKRSV